MYVIQLQVRAGDITGLSYTNNTTHILPADRCSWRQDADPNGGYFITDVFFYSGADTDGILVSAGSGATTNKTTLGYIGKSGRFTGITNPNPDA